MDGGHHSENPMRQAARSHTTTAGFAPESLIFLAFLILVAVLAKRAGALTGNGTGYLGYATACVSCACLYAGLGIATRRVSLKEGLANAERPELGLP